MKPLLFSLALLLCAACAAAAERPNVVLILSDDQRYDTIGALGNQEIQTPHLDKLVARGKAFTQTYIMGSTQGAVCVSSRACLMSGRSLFRIDNNLQDAPLLPDLLAAAGVKTFGIGKWHNGKESYARAFDDGDAVFFGGMHDHFRIPVWKYDKSGKFPAAAKLVSEQFSTELFADKAIDFLGNYRGEAPFFLYVALTAPHDPRTPPGKYKTMYDPEKLALPKNFLPEHPFDNGELEIRDEKLAPRPRTEKIVREHLAAYYGMISHLDEQVGRVLAALEKSPHAKNTIVVFSSDNGLAVGQHGLLGKQSLYEHSIRVPLIVAGPNIAPGKIAEPVYLYDLFPTVCAWQSAKVPANVEAQSLVPLLEGKDVEPRDIYAAYRDVQRSIRQREWKLIYYPKIDRTQVFNLTDDPWETNDLMRDDDFAASDGPQEMRAHLRELQRQYGDPLK